VNDVTSDGYTGRANETTGADEFNAKTFLINQVLSGKWTITLCVVKSVSGGGVDVPPIVSVQPLVNQVDGQGNPTPHGIINGIPVFRLQGGANAIISDPVAGDIGLLATASRDISAVKNNKAPSNPGSQRMFDPADGLYLGSFFSAAPTQYVQFSEAGITLKAGSATLVIGSDGTVKINGIDFSSHVHTGVTTGGANSGPPLA
jgi:hypothetical protein